MTLGRGRDQWCVLVLLLGCSESQQWCGSQCDECRDAHLVVVNPAGESSLGFEEVCEFGERAAKEIISNKAQRRCQGQPESGLGPLF